MAAAIIELILVHSLSHLCNDGHGSRSVGTFALGTRVAQSARFHLGLPEEREQPISLKRSTKAIARVH